MPSASITRQPRNSDKAYVSVVDALRRPRWLANRQQNANTGCRGMRAPKSTPAMTFNASAAVLKPQERNNYELYIYLKAA